MHLRSCGAFECRNAGCSERSHGITCCCHNDLPQMRESQGPLIELIQEKGVKRRLTGVFYLKPQLGEKSGLLA